MTGDTFTDEQLEAIEMMRGEALTHLEHEINDMQDYINKSFSHLRDEFEVWFDAEIDKLSERLGGGS